MTYSISIIANESIKFTWKGSTSSTSVTNNKSFDITATNGKQFTIDWGDDSDIETITGTGNEQNLNHTYVNTNNSTIYAVKITGVTADCLFTDLNLYSKLLTTLDLSTNTALRTLVCNNNSITTLDLSANILLQSLNCSSNPLRDLDLNANTALQSLNCSGNSLTTLNLSTNTLLQSLNCSINSLTNLDLNANTALQTLYCYYNQLTTLDLNANKLLRTLNCYNNSLTTLTLSANTLLQSLNCYSNLLTALDLKANTLLQDLSCSSNSLTTLDLSGNTLLQEVVCSNNSLTVLDINTNTVLQTLYCNNNLLTALALKANTALETLYCQNNQLTTLELRANTKLKTLNCPDNQLTALDLCTNTRLQNLMCYNNSLNTLDLSANTLLQSLGCDNNQLTALYTNSQLNSLYTTNNRLLLSDLYNTTKMMSGTAIINLGTQILVPQEAIVGSSVDYSAQKEFGGKTTVFTVKKSGLPALLSSDYTIDDGIITFNNTGNYTVTMTNSALLPVKSSSSAVETTRKIMPPPPNVPAQVIAEFNVIDYVGITNAQATGIAIYPNPTKGQLTIDNGQTAFGLSQLTIGDIALFDIMGKKQLSIINCQLSIHQIDISHLPAGIYYLQIAGKTTKVVKN